MDNEMGAVPNEINWQIEERPINFKNKEWLWALVIVSFAIVIFSILLKNYLLIIIVALAAFIIYASKNKMPNWHHFRLNGEGLSIDNKIFPYDNFESFWIFESKEIAFRRKHHFMPLLTIPFSDRQESLIREIVSNHLPEVEEEETFLDLLQKNIF